ncbi:MAG TPA: TetR/AcrR family transcriptional regulator [Acidimicrobiales bacterium]|nr:TetR/AcrR family transcriptional regulator [Acidimicrobiales bacterium]
MTALAAETGDRGGAPKRVRKNPDLRRAEIVATAREVFAATGYAESGLAEIASAASVSKGLLYHYFPDGRPQLFVSVMAGLLEEFQQRLRQASKMPFSPRTRMEQLLAALFGFFDENPAAYRLLFRDPWVTHDEAVEASAIATRVQIASELASLMAGSGLPADDLVSASTGMLGFALANVELAIAGQVDAETAWRVTCEYATSRFGD